MLKKKIILSGFTDQDLNFFKKKFSKLRFYKYKDIKNYKKFYDAFISKDRKSFENFYKKDFNKLKNCLKWIHISVSGLDSYNKLLKNKNFFITNSKTAQGPQVAEHVFALLLSLTRNIYLIAKRGDKVKFENRPIELNKKKILVIGYGEIGKRVLKRAYSFGMKTTVLSKTHYKTPYYVKKMFLAKELKKALLDQDVVVFCVPLTKKTKKMYNSKTANFFKKGSIIINVSRDEVVCKKTLYKNLKNKKILAAGFDVIETKKKINENYNLKKLDNFISTPHIAGISDNFKHRNDILIKKNLDNFQKNKRLVNIVKVKDLL